MTTYLLQWRRYARSFRQPLSTNHGQWTVREGILVRLRDSSGRTGWGEIAPIPWFGSETLQQAIDYCRSLEEQVTAAQIAEIPDDLPACQFGLVSALEVLQSGTIDDSGQKPELGQKLEYSVLISPEVLPEAGHLTANPSTPPGKTFKCKIGVAELDCELQQLDRLLKILPAHSKLRLDANGGLNEAEAIVWLTWCDAHPQIEFLEQPLPPDAFLQMQRLSQQFQTPIALDESVATIDQLQDCYQQGWNGIFVIKPAIAGSPARLRQFCREYQPDVVWSSALETSIGQRYIEDCLIPETGLGDRAIGFGVDHWFTDDWGQRSAESVWQELAGTEP